MAHHVVKVPAASAAHAARHHSVVAPLEEHVVAVASAVAVASVAEHAAEAEAVASAQEEEEGK